MPKIGRPPVPRTKKTKLEDYPIDNIAPGLLGNVVPVDSLTPDPNNARIHNPRNMAVIRQSLAVYGQMKPLVVRQEGMVVIAGNGTLQAAKELGWTRIGVVVKSMHQGEAVGYGIADNRASDLAGNNEEVIARLDRLLEEEGLSVIGYKREELQVLRMVEWMPPPAEEVNFSVRTARVLRFNSDQAEVIDEVVKAAAKRMGKAKSRSRGDEECIVFALQEWLHAQG